MSDRVLLLSLNVVVVVVGGVVVAVVVVVAVDVGVADDMVVFMSLSEAGIHASYLLLCGYTAAGQRREVARAPR